MDQLAQAYFFRALDADELALLHTLARSTEVPQGAVILKQGQSSEHLYVVRSGSVRVMIPFPGEDLPTRSEQTLVVLGPGECFGEFAFVDGKPSSATVIAGEDAALYSIAHRDLEAKLLARPETAAKIYKALLHILVSRIRNTDLELAMRKAVGD